ncbi:Uma2 family endonuclease [Limnothrix redekei]|uniref:Uma2 family endonuclease n=1 Tax=Limnothrix redekei LRLZ20PSL1 TaxID=3112953 RepID=A0ABW7CCK9_9CYAN
MIDLVTIAPNPTVASLDEGWLAGSWTDFRQQADRPELAAARCFYHDGWFLIDMSPVGPLHGRDNTLLSAITLLYAMQQGIRIHGYTNTSFQRSGEREAQPDIAFYLGDDRRLPPANNAIVDLDQYAPPTLVIEIAASSLNTDLGFKRLLYEQLGIQEYWVVDSVQSQVMAFGIDQGRSGMIETSAVLPNLSIALVSAALQRSQQESQGETLQWLMQQWTQVEQTG